jgi:hypothetical protein
MNEKEQAKILMDYSFNLLSIEYDSRGRVMNRTECLPKAKMIARSHITFLLYEGNLNADVYYYWVKVQREIDQTSR